MTTKELENKLELALKSKLKKEGYVKSGSLLKSISFKVTFTNNKLSIKLNANDYIEFLDEGNFIKDFYNSAEIIELSQIFLTVNLQLL
jgi:hypothetical protein